MSRARSSGALRVLWVADKLGYGAELHDVGRWYLSVAAELRGVAVVPAVLRAEPDLVARLQAKGLKVIPLRCGRLNPLTLWRLIRLIRKERIDAVHAHGYGASTFGRLAAGFCGIPAVVHQHDSVVEGPWYARLCDRLLSGGASAALAVSESVRDFCSDERSLPAARTLVWHPGVRIEEKPVDASRRSAAKSALGIGADASVIGALARLVPEKGLRCLIEALPRILATCPTATVLIVGDGPERPALEAIAGRLGVETRIRWMGHSDDPVTCLAAMDVFVSTSVVDGAQAAVFEAMAAGLTIVATAVSGTVDVLAHDRNAWLVPSRDPRALADAVRHLLNDPDRRAKLAAQAWADSRRYDIRAYADRLGDLYQRLAAGGEDKRPASLSGFSRFKTLFKYMTVGAGGAAVHLGTLWFLVELGRLPVLAATTTGFIAAVVTNFILNRLWTFRSRERNVRLQFVRFVIVSLYGLGINALLMWVLVHVCAVRYMVSQVLTIGIVSVWNFLANTYWTFQPIRFAAPDQPLPQYPFDVSVVIPALNEESRLPVTLRNMSGYFKTRGLRAEILVVDDGSTDRTLELVTAMPDEGAHLRVIHNPVNRGKGAAVRSGFRAAQAAYVLMMDADNATPIESLDALWPQRSVDTILIGSRHARGWWRRPGVPWLRFLISRLGNQMIQWLLLPGVHDTQCGFKLFSFPVARALAARQRISRFGFDMELLAIARALGIKMKEVEVPWSAIAGSRVRPVRDAWRVFGELMSIKANLMTGAYHLEQPVALQARNAEAG